jgi:hypothetical protein
MLPPHRQLTLGTWSCSGFLHCGILKSAPQLGLKCEFVGVRLPGSTATSHKAA